MSLEVLRVVIADDERPARSFLASLLRAIPDVTIVGEAANGAEAVKLIEQLQPDVAFLDLQMPEVDGLTAVRLIKRKLLPLVVFVTAHNEFAVRAFELNAVDYVLKPASAARVRDTVQRVRQRLEGREARAAGPSPVQMAAVLRDYERSAPQARLDRIPVRHQDDILLVPAAHVASIVAEGELLHLTTLRGEKHTISYRLKDLESRLDDTRFIRLGRGTLANIECITRVMPLPGGLYAVRLSNGQELDVSRIQSKVLKQRLLSL